MKGIKLKEVLLNGNQRIHLREFATKMQTTMQDKIITHYLQWKILQGKY